MGLPSHQQIHDLQNGLERLMPAIMRQLSRFDGGIFLAWDNQKDDAPATSLVTMTTGDAATIARLIKMIEEFNIEMIRTGYAPAVSILGEDYRIRP